MIPYNNEPLWKGQIIYMDGRTYPCEHDTTHP